VERALIRNFAPLVESETMRAYRKTTRKRSGLPLAVIVLFVAQSALFGITCPPEPFGLIGRATEALKLLGAPPFKVLTSFAKDRKTMPMEDFLAKPTLTSMTLNAENYFVTTKDIPGGIHGERPHFDPKQVEKSLPAREAIARIIDHYKPDLICIQEMQDLIAAQELAGRVNGKTPSVLDDYIPLIIEGNDGRGIDNGVYIHSALPVDIAYVSHKNEPMNSPLYNPGLKAFTRDVTAAVVTVQGTNTPLLIALTGHFKSKISKDGPDPEGRGRRAAESEAAARIVAYYEALYPDVPIIFGGDFNGAVHKDPEFKALREKAKLKDVFDAMPDPAKRIPSDDPRRRNYTYFPPEGGVIYNQLDALLANTHMQPHLVSAEVGENFDPSGKVLPHATTKAEEDALGTDHRAFLAILDLQSLFRARKVREQLGRH
jgi:hypothetical protein